MARTGLLVLKDFQSVSSISHLLSQSRGHIKGSLSHDSKWFCYIIKLCIQKHDDQLPLKSTLFVKPNYDQVVFNSNEISKSIFQVISKIYSASDVHCPGLDVRVLLPSSVLPKSELILSDDSSFLSESINSVLLHTIPQTVPFNPIQAQLTSPRFTQSCLGGTFDRLHAGHKILLSEALLVAKQRAVIGLAFGDLLNQKLLRELILPFDKRKDDLQSFLDSIQNHLQSTDIVPIDEPFGPSITDANLEVMVLSAEVEAAIKKVNELRESNQLRPLCSHVINNGVMVADEKESTFKPTETVSSSAGRVGLLGTLLKPVLKLPEDNKPYVIGITGMLASGKSSVCKRLEKMGAYRLDADKLGHLAYVPQTSDHKEGPAYKAVIEYFGNDIVNPETKFVDRKKLGAKVFADPKERKKLEEIVWPAIAELCDEEIKLAYANDSKVIVLEAAVLLEAEWDKSVNEVWCVHVPTAESIRRSVERDNIPEEQVRKRIEAQIPLEKRVEKSNLVISTFWEPEITQQICEKAWSQLSERIK